MLSSNSVKSKGKELDIITQSIITTWVGSVFPYMLPPKKRSVKV
jgi:hypothetical protein